MSPSSRTKSNTLALSAIRFFLVDFGMTMKPCLARRKRGRQRECHDTTARHVRRRRPSGNHGERKKGAHAVEPVPDQDLRRRLVVFLREFDHDGVVEPLAADERGPRFEGDGLRAAVLDEVDAGHEGVEVLLSRAGLTVSGRWSQREKSRDGRFGSRRGCTWACAREGPRGA